MKKLRHHLRDPVVLLGLTFFLGFIAARICRKNPKILYLFNLHIHHYFWATIFLVTIFALFTAFPKAIKLWAILGGTLIGIMFDELEMLLKLKPNDYGSFKGLYFGTPIFLFVIFIRSLVARLSKNQNDG